jgi:2-keto-4-pentenoate hydratase/2-oxohepta-3-ene-1,7-dioic acid hydratase in catechol pathway
MADYKLLNYADDNGRARPGLAVGDQVIDLQSAVEAYEGKGAAAGFSPASTLSVLEDWDAAEPVLETIAGAGDGATRPLADTRLMAPLLYPNAIFNAAANYSDHRAEMGNEPEIDKSTVKPYFFLKSPAHTVIGPGDEVRIPHVTQQVDWECELGVVIGRYGRNLTQANARGIVAGYTIFNDLSARDLGRREDWQQFRSDWFGQKSFACSAPTGPWIVPAKQIPDPYACKMDTWVNDTHMQDAVAGQMIFNIEEQIEYLSARMTLRPGDLIATGTPSGVGRPRGIFLQPGDTVRLTIGGIGELSNPIVKGE